jgi:hypothetical protein
MTWPVGCFPWTTGDVNHAIGLLVFAVRDICD